MTILLVIACIVLLGGLIYGIQIFSSKIKIKYERDIDKLLLEVAKIFALDTQLSTRNYRRTDWKPPILTGKIENFETLIKVKEVKIGDQDAQYMMSIEVEIPSSFYFELYRNAGAMELIYGKTNVDFKDKAFSKFFLVRTTSSKILPTVLDAHLREKCLEVKKSFQMQRLIVRNGKIQFDYPLYRVNMGRKQNIERMILLMILVAKQLERLKV